MAYAKEDLKDRLECIPNGRLRWRLMHGHLSSLMNDLIGTMPRKQCVNLKSVMHDMELRLVPKFTRVDQRVTMNVDDLSYLVNHAKKDICATCILDGDECRQCELYKILEAIAPLQDWGSSTVCPYLRDDWMDR